MRRHSGIISVLLAVAAISCGAAHAENDPDRGWGEVTFRPWIGTLGVRFHSESLFEEPAPARPFPDGRAAANGLSDQASTAGLQGFSLQGEWRPFRNGFRLNFAMYLDPVESDDAGLFRARKLAKTGSASDDLGSLSSFEAIPYVGLGWRTNGGGLDVNLDIGAFLSGEDSLRADSCPGSGPPLAGCGAASFGNGRGKLSSSFRSFEWYPVVSLGLEYRF